MADKATATLGGFNLILADEGVSWTLTEGVQPSVGTFMMDPRDALAIDAVAGPVTLEIRPVQGEPVIVQHLWVDNIEPGPNPYLSKVEVSDRRRFWVRSHVERRYNMRRNVGVKRLLANDAQLDINFDRAASIAYWYWSLNPEGGNKWVAFTMIQDVLSQVAQIEQAHWGQTFKAVLDDRVGQKITNLPIEELTIVAPGDAAVMQAIAMLPEAGVTVDYDGTVIIFSKAAGDEIQIVSALMPEIWDQGHTDLVSNKHIRPKEVHVLFTREVEVRYDFVENALASNATVTDDPLGDLRRMENVLPIPDYQLTVNNRVLPQGSWITFDQAFNAWDDLPLIGITRKLDHDIIQRAFIPQMDLWSALGLVGTLPDQEGDIRNWVGRISMCQLHYRQTFRLNTRWTDRSLSIRAYRLATIDPQSGQRGPSMAYGDYCILPSQRARYRNIALGKPMYYAMNKTAYPGERDANGDLVTNGINALDSTALPGPGVVSILDADQGIVRVDYAMDQTRSYEMVLPSQMKLDQMPTANITQRTRPIAFNQVMEGQKPPRLSPSFKMCLIVTQVPASPNTNQNLHRLVVKPGDVSDLLPTTAQAGLGEAQGPIMEIRIGAGVEVARIRWSDNAQDIVRIEKIFGLTKVGKSIGEQVSFSEELAPLCLNVGSTSGKAGGSLNEIAKAQAASIYASFADRYEGSFTAAMNGGVHLSGWTSSIEHRYNADGATVTKVVFPRTIPAMSLFSFLSMSERAVILKLVQA